MAKSEIKMKMSLDSSGVKKSLARTKASIANFAKAGVDKLNTLAKFATGGLVAGFAAASRSALSYGKEIKTLARLSGSTVDEFQRQSAAAKTVGIEQDKLADIFKDTNDKIGDFMQTGGGAMADFFENIAPQVGVTADEFANLSGPAALQLYYDSLEKANLSQQDMTFYMEAIASDSTALVPLLANGGQAFKQLGDEAASSGLIMSKATADALGKSQIAIDNFKQKATIFVGRIISGAGDHAALKAFGLRLAAKMLEMGEFLANGFLKAGKLLASLLYATVTTVGSKLSTAFQVAAIHLKKAVAPIINKLVDGLSNIGLDLGAGIDISQIDKDLENINKKSGKTFAQNFTEAQEAMSGIKADASEGVDALNAMAGDQDRVLNSANKTAEALEKAKQITGGIAGNLRKMTREQENALELAEALASGDQNLIQLANKKISKEERINALKEATKAGDEDVLRIVEQQIEQEQKKKALQTDLINAQVSGNTKAITAAEKKIALEEKALEIAEKTGEEFHDAVILAERVLQHEAGPDLNQSGFVTRKEQREFDRQQKEIAKQNKKDQHEEKMKEMREGGSLRNVSKQKREELQNKIKERKLNERQDKEKQRKLEDQARRERLDPRRKQERLKQEKAQEEEKKRGAERKAAAKKAEEQQKQVDNNPVVKGLKPVLDKQLTELVKINKALNCEG